MAAEDAATPFPKTIYNWQGESGMPSQLKRMLPRRHRDQKTEVANIWRLQYLTWTHHQAAAAGLHTVPLPNAATETTLADQIKTEIYAQFYCHQQRYENITHEQAQKRSGLIPMLRCLDLIWPTFLELKQADIFVWVGASVPLKRSAITQLQKACRSNQSNKTELFHYGHISVIEEMVGASSPLSRHVEDTYFNHWSPDADDGDGVNDDPSNYPKSTLFFKKVFEHSFMEQREGENCSCCHEHCKYHDHESEAEAHRLSTRSVAPTTVVKSCGAQKAAMRISLNDVLVSDFDRAQLSL
ncbi:hypothetical protein KCU93_g366, partial [Aureobasidium melanogenum]